MNDIDNHTDDYIDKALNIMEGLAEKSDKQTQQLSDDKACLETCRDIMDSAFILQFQKGLDHSDIEIALKRFKKKHQPSHKHYFIKRIIIGVAAMITILSGSYYIVYYILPSTPITVFTADHSPQQITLQKENGEKVTSEEEKTQASQVTTTSHVAVPAKESDYFNAQAGQQTDVTAKTYTLTIPRGESYKVTLCDGTEVWLNANSHFIYPTAFTGKERIVSLKGEAYFKVAKDIKRPFIVQTPDIQTRVLGTEFNIKSYTPEDTHVVLIKGSVEVSNTKGGSYAKLVPGEDAHLQPDGDFVMNKVETESYVYWKDGYFYFDDITLLDIMQSIGKWYNVNVEFCNKEALNYRMHFLAKRSEGLEHTIKLLNKMKKVHIVLENNTLIVE